MLVSFANQAFAHGVTLGDQGYIQEITGVNILPFMYLGAKHMISGYDHLLFLFAVIFFVYRPSHISLYVSLFALGHSSTLIIGVYFNIQANAFLVDAIIGLSIVYKALDNLNAFKRWFNYQLNTKVMTLIFGLFHGFGLATKIQDFDMSADGLLPNLIAFNIGVEIGQILALSFILIGVTYWRRFPSFMRQAYTANVMIMSAGFLLMFYQLSALALS
ncbi:MAG: HupE/UreJ family protein [Oceanospirillaceae bacterium]